jgi:prepilin-type N-terminal cleavage/methylation domain-containing protein
MRIIAMGRSAFSLIEMMVVLIIVSIVAGFAIPDYTKSVERSHRKDAENNLLVIQAAQMMYAAKNGDYWGAGNLAQINANLGVNIVANGMTYSCDGPSAGPPPTFACHATRNGWSLRITESLTTPSCNAGSCP